MVVNPASSRRTSDGQHAPISTAQIQTLLETVYSHRLYPLLLLAATTGLRRSELVGLRWADLDLTSGTALITGPPQRGRTDAPNARVVRIGQPAATALTAWQDMQNREPAARGPFYHHHGHVFTSPDGRPYRPAQLARARSEHRCDARASTTPTCTACAPTPSPSTQHPAPSVQKGRT